MTSRTTASFRKAFASLPEDVQERAREAFRLFSDNPAHPSLQFRQVHATEPIFSARITLQYRALARHRNDDWIWFWIGSHADYDQLLKRLWLRKAGPAGWQFSRSARPAVPVEAVYKESQ